MSTASDTAQTDIRFEKISIAARHGYRLGNMGYVRSEAQSFWVEALEWLVGQTVSAKWKVAGESWKRERRKRGLELFLGDPACLVISADEFPPLYAPGPA